MLNAKKNKHEKIRTVGSPAVQKPIQVDSTISKPVRRKRVMKEANLPQKKRPSLMTDDERAAKLMIRKAESENSLHQLEFKELGAAASDSTIKEFLLALLSNCRYSRVASLIFDELGVDRTLKLIDPEVLPLLFSSVFYASPPSSLLELFEHVCTSQKHRHSLDTTSLSMIASATASTNSNLHELFCIIDGDQMRFGESPVHDRRFPELFHGYLQLTTCMHVRVGGFQLASGAYC